MVLERGFNAKFCANKTATRSMPGRVSNMFLPCKVPCKQQTTQGGLLGDYMHATSVSDARCDVLERRDARIVSAMGKSANTAHLYIP